MVKTKWVNAAKHNSPKLKTHSLPAVVMRSTIPFAIDSAGHFDDTSSGGYGRPRMS